MKTINKTTFLRRMISSKAYYSNRMAEMDRKCAFYLDSGVKASNKILNRAFIETAEMYKKRYAYYFQKISENRIFA